jgi:hypothetical protein
VPELDDLERALDHRAAIPGGDGGRVVARVQHQDEAAAEAGTHLLDRVHAARVRQVDDDRVDRDLGQSRPVLDCFQLADPVGVAQQRAQGDSK